MMSWKEFWNAYGLCQRQLWEPFRNWNCNCSSGTIDSIVLAFRCHIHCINLSSVIWLRSAPLCRLLMFFCLAGVALLSSVVRVPSCCLSSLPLASLLIPPAVIMTPLLETVPCHARNCTVRPRQATARGQAARRPAGRLLPGIWPPRGQVPPLPPVVTSNAGRYMILEPDRPRRALIPSNPAWSRPIRLRSLINCWCLQHR